MGRAMSGAKTIMSRTAMAAKARALSRDRRGATMIEFAVVAGPFIALILAGIQTSLVFFSQQLIETVAESSGRQLMTGAVQLAGTTQAQYKADVCSRLPDFMTCANTYVDVRTSNNFATVSTAPPVFTYSGNSVTNVWSFARPGAGQIAIVRVMYLLPVAGGPLGFRLADQPNSRRLLIATSVFKTEQFE